MFRLYCCAVSNSFYDTYSECCEPCWFCHVNILIQNIIQAFCVFHLYTFYTIGLPWLWNTCTVMWTTCTTLYCHILQSNCTRLGSKGSLIRGLTPANWPDGYAMLMSPNKGETAVHGCHCPGDMVVRMRKILAIPRIGVGTCAWYCHVLPLPTHNGHFLLSPLHGGPGGPFGEVRLYACSSWCCYWGWRPRRMTSSSMTIFLFYYFIKIFL